MTPPLRRRPEVAATALLLALLLPACAADRDGGRAAAPHGAFVEDRPVVGWAESGEIHFHGPGFELRRIVRIERGPVLPGPRDGDLALWAAELRPYHERRWSRRAAEVLPPPERLPAFFSIEPGTRGTTWVAMAPDVREGPGIPWTRWLRLDASGRPTHWVVAPTLHYLEMGERHLVALERDELEVQHVRVYALAR